jgi:predicted nucleic acid-binding protein
LSRIVCDTGPLLHLQEAGCLEILQAAGEITIPPAVRSELINHDSFWDRHMPEWIEPGILEPRFLESAAHWLQAGLLDSGEAEALSLATQLKAHWLLTDDAAARLIAQQQGLEVHGSLGVVLWAAATGHFHRFEAERALDSLFHSSLWLSASVRAEARAALRQMFSGPGA